MRAPRLFQAEVNIQTVLGSPVAISGLTKASTGVATSAAHGLSNGDLLLLQVPGWPELIDRVVRVAAVDTDTFQLEGIDTTNFPGTFASGTFQEITFGASCQGIQEGELTGGEANRQQYTTIHRSKAYSYRSFEEPMLATFRALRDITDPGVLELWKAHKERPPYRAIELIFHDGSKLYFYGDVSASGGLQAAGDAPITTPVSVGFLGDHTDYVS